MKTIKEYSKDAILAVLGTVDEQNEDIKDLLERGSAIMGMGIPENEELCYNGNREEIERRRAERAEADRRARSVGGVELTYNREPDYDGEGSMKRTVELTTQSEEKLYREALEDAERGGNDGRHGDETKTDTQGDVRGDQTT